MSSSRKAIIVGAGPAGLAAALRLHQTTNIEPVIYELRSAPTTLGGAVGMSSNGTRLLDRLGVLEAALQRGNSRSGLALYSLHKGELGRLDDFAARGRAKTGYGYLRIQRPDLVDVLLEAVRKAGIPVRFGFKVVGVEESSEKVHVSFEDGSTDAADFLFGCDGIHSAVRKLYVDPPTQPEYSGVAVLFSVIPTTEVSKAVTTPMAGINVTFTQQGLFMAMLCTAAEDAIYWGFSREVAVPDVQGARDGWEVRGKQEVEGFRQHLHEILAGGQEGGWNDALRELLDATPVMNFYPIYRLPLGGTWFRGRCLLLGDAAHAVQPHAAQGVGLALEDVFIMARTLADPDRPVNEAHALFERARRPRVKEVCDTAASNAGLRKDMDPEQQSRREDAFRNMLATADGTAAADQFLAQKFATYDIDNELVV